MGPLLLALVFGIFDFGRALSANVTVTNATKEAARYLAAYASSTSGPIAGYYGVPSCFTLSPTTGPTSGAASKAWSQLAAASLDLSEVKEIDVYFYASGNLPENDTSGTHSAASYSLKCSSTVNTSTPSYPSSSTYTPSTGDWVVVEVKYTFVTSTPLIHLIFPNVTLDATTTMVLE